MSFSGLLLLPKSYADYHFLAKQEKGEQMLWVSVICSHDCPPLAVFLSKKGVGDEPVAPSHWLKAELLWLNFWPLLTTHL